MGYSLRSTITAALLKLIRMHDCQFNVTFWVGNVLRKRKIHIFKISDATRLFADLLHDHETFQVGEGGNGPFNRKLCQEPKKLVGKLPETSGNSISLVDIL